MKTKPNLTIQTLGSRFLIVDESPANDPEATAIHTLNPTAAAIWSHIAELPSFTLEQVADWLVENFEVDPARARADLRALFAQWQTQSLILPD